MSIQNSRTDIRAPEARADPVGALAGELVPPQAATARVSAARPASAKMRPQEPGNRDAGFRVWRGMTLVTGFLSYSKLRRKVRRND